ncbi:hypothetical protein [Aureimonas populi]|uniref:Capsule biosynthesis protein n=1 Tax=Aureimonas populi TaxID=1701758 RepID=A0ABW5CML2_9HYPH|nr:hypothetical protein [Aureimonas populi]
MSGPAGEKANQKQPGLTLGERLLGEGPSSRGQVVSLPLNAAQRLGERLKARRRRRSLGLNLFLAIVAVPTLVIALYYGFVASDQYQSESRFAVRGTETSPLADLGLSALPGTTTQASDAYIVNEYIRSVQLLRDLIDDHGIDLRQFYGSPDIDAFYRIDPSMPLERFVSYWNRVSESEYNSTTSITTFQVRAFSREDAQTISSAVLAAAAKLVNQLSREARDQLIRTAEAEVLRTERRLAGARSTLTAFRNREQSLDPQLRASSNEALVQQLQGELADLNTRRAALRSTISGESPSLRVIDRQIAAVEEELQRQRSAVGSGTEAASLTAQPSNRNLAMVLNDYSALVLEEEFAQKAYMAALSALETSQAEARKQERYFATVVRPTDPAVPLYPSSLRNTMLAFAVLVLLWLLSYFVMQSVRDHAV